MSYRQSGQGYNPSAQGPPVPPRPPGHPRSSYNAGAGDESRPADSSNTPYGARYGGDLQSQVTGRRPNEQPMPPYPLDTYEHPRPAGQHSTSYSYHHPPPTTPYNPAQYAQAAHGYSYFSQQSYGSQQTPSSQSTSQPYNPALYSDNSIAQLANHLYGPTAGGPVSDSLPYRPQAAPTSAPSLNLNHPKESPPPQYEATFTSTYDPSRLPQPPPRRSTYTSQYPFAEIYGNHFPDPQYAPQLSPGSHSQTFFASSSTTPDPGDIMPSPFAPETLPAFQRNYFLPDHQHVLYLRPDETFDSPPFPSSPDQPTETIQTSGYHSLSRPLPSVPLSEEHAQDALFREVESAVMGNGSTSPERRRDSRPPLSSRFRRNSQGFARGYPAPDQSSVLPNGSQPNVSQPSSEADQAGNEEDVDYDSDTYAAAGLEAMRRAERQEAVERERAPEPFQQEPLAVDQQLVHDRTESSDEHSDTEYPPMPSADIGFPGVDIGSLTGGYDFNMSYGPDSNAILTSSRNQNVEQGYDVPSRQHSGASTQSIQLPAESQAGGSSSHTSMGDLSRQSHSGRSRHLPVAQVDRGGTGGLLDPTTDPIPRKLSFDEGDERPYFPGEDEQDLGSGEIEDLEFYPTPTVSRPLPPPPEEDESMPYSPVGSNQVGDQFSAFSTSGQYPEAPDMYMTQSANGKDGVPRSQSVFSQSSTPHPIPPIRAKTDAEERKRQSYIKGYLAGTEPGSGYDTMTPQTASSLGLDLPTLPSGRRFQPNKLTQLDFDSCGEPWALSSITSWLRALAGEETELKQNALIDALVALFSNKVPTLSVADTETLVSVFMSEMFTAGTLVVEEEWLKFGPVSPTGVLYQLTGQGCYSPKAHDHELSGRCYAHHCQRTVKKMNLQAQGERNREGWTSFFKMTKEQYAHVDKKEVERQNVLHEIVQTEDDYTDQLHVLQILYRDALRSANPPILLPKRKDKFISDVFGKLDAVQKVNMDYLLPQLKYRQKEQGPWIFGFSDIFRDWIRKAKAAYIDYAAGYPNANFLMRQEKEKNLLFQSFLEGARNNEKSQRLSWETFLKAPITRLQRYGLLLTTVHRNMSQDSEERSNLKTAIDEIKAVTLDCDSRVAETSRKVDLTDLSSRLMLRPEMRQVELNLGHWGRELIFKGDLQRIGANRFTWLETHAMLFDHYMVLAKIVPLKNSASGRSDKYDVSKMPIPMDLLTIESTNDDPVIKSKGIASVTSVTTKAGTQPDLRIHRVSASGQSSFTSTMSSTAVSSLNSSKTMVTTTNLETTHEKILYPFRIRHLGKEMYTLFASSSQNRQDWCDKIIEAKTKHAASLFAQNAEPFRLRVIADSAFAYDAASVGQKSILINGTPLSRAIDEVENTYKITARPVPICRAKVNCASTFLHPSGKQMIAVGSDYGVFVSEVGNPRGWSRAITIMRVSQIAVLEDFNLFLVLSDKSLIAYHLDVVCPVSGPTSNTSDDSPRKAPQKLSGAKDVGFFATGRMKDRMLLFYKKREGISSTFKVLEPVLQKSATPARQSRFSSFAAHRPRGATDFFREYDDFYIPLDCTSISLFNSSLSVSTTKGFEILNLDKKTPWTIPDLKPPHVATIAARLAGCDPVGMFRLSDAGSGSGAPGSSPSHHRGSSDASAGANSEFLCVYSECAVYVNKHGDISRSVVMEFVGLAKSAALHGPYLLLFDNDFVEIRNAQNGRLKQILAGRDVRCLDDGRGTGVGGVVGEGTAWNGRTVKIAMQHPEQERVQIVVELVLNEQRRD